MRLARILGGIGRTLISAGVIILLFVAYQLWGTGIQHARAQDSLADDFNELLETAPLDVFETPAADDPARDPGSDDPASDDPASDDPGSDDPASDDPGSDDPVIVTEDGATTPTRTTTISAELDETALRLLYPDNGEVIARIDIPRIGVSEFVVEGVRVEDLRKGPGHYLNSPLPGQPGNAAIAGHRTTYGAPFHRIDELSPGDEIRIRTLQGDFTYRVMPQTDGSGETKGHFIVSPNEVGVLDDFGDNRLTLTACHPKYSARQRIIVVAELVEEPKERLPRPEELVQARAIAAEGDDLGGELAVADAELPTAGLEVAAPVAVPEDSFGEGLNGDRDAILPAVFWGIAALSVWLAAWYLARGWRRWPSYALFLIPFLVLLFVSFIHVDQAIPSY